MPKPPLRAAALIYPWASPCSSCASAFSRDRAVARNLAAMQQAVHARQQFDEQAEFRGAHRTAVHDLTLTQPPRHRGPRIALERFQAERDLAPGLVDAKHFHGHLLADAEP